MTLMEKIPSMEEGALKTLFDNAKRLETTGTDRQKADVAELLPALEAALAERKATRLEAAAEKRAKARELGAPARRVVRKTAASKA